MKSAKGGINPTRSDEIVITMKSSLREGDIDTPLWGSEAKPRVLNDSLVDCQTPR